jgi:predicted phage replisome organizer
MAEVQWIKIVTDIFDNRKIKQIEHMPEADAILVIWFKLLCLAGNINESGLLLITKDIPYTEEMLANEFKRPLNTVRLALGTFQRFGMIEIVDDVLGVSNWEKYQSVDKLSQIKEQNRLRKRKQRAKMKALPAPESRDSHVTVPLPVTQGHATETEQEQETEKEIELDKDNNKLTNKQEVLPKNLDEYQMERVDFVRSLFDGWSITDQKIYFLSSLVRNKVVKIEMNEFEKDITMYDNIQKLTDQARADEVRYIYAWMQKVIPVYEGWE